MSTVLDTFRTAAAARPRIAAYLASSMRFPFTLGEMGKDGGYSYSSGSKLRRDLK